MNNNLVLPHTFIAPPLWLFAIHKQLAAVLSVMKKFLLIALVIVVLPVLAGAQGWRVYTSKQGRFSIEFPGKVDETVRKDTSGGPDVHYVTWFPNDSMGYMVDWTDLGAHYPASTPLKQLLEQSRDAATHTIQASNVITTATSLGREPYIEFSYTSAEFTGRGRVYIINKVQYVVLTLFPRSTGVSDGAGRFIRSFRYRW